MAIIHQLLKFWDINGQVIGSIAVDVDDSLLTTDPVGVGVAAYNAIGTITATGPDMAALFDINGVQIGQVTVTNAANLNQTQLASRARQAIFAVTLNSQPLDLVAIRQRVG